VADQSFLFWPHWINTNKLYLKKSHNPSVAEKYNIKLFLSLIVAIYSEARGYTGLVVLNDLKSKQSNIYTILVHCRSIIGNMCMRHRNGGKGEALPSLFLRFAPNTHIFILQWQHLTTNIACPIFFLILVSYK
jgi:hypothetical protein